MKEVNHLKEKVKPPLRPLPPEKEKHPQERPLQEREVRKEKTTMRTNLKRMVTFTWLRRNGFLLKAPLFKETI